MNRKIVEIDFNEIFPILEYDPTSSTFLRWKINHSSRARIGCEAGVIKENQQGRKSISIRVNKKDYYGHRVVWVLVHGNISTELQVDHINGDPLDNNIDNLRVVTHKVNQRNQKIRVSNKTGAVGVDYDKRTNRFRSSYYDASGNFIQKHFSCKKFGKELAFKLAQEWREDAIEKLNSILGENSYTERHGT